MNRYVTLYIILFLILFMQSCTVYETRKPAQHIIPVEENQEFSISIIEGKTTKQEVIDALGMPDSISEFSLAYRFRGKDICKLTLVQKDGSIFNVLLGTGDEYKYNDMGISLDYNNRKIVDNVHLY